jgi:hypothetical protein
MSSPQDREMIDSVLIQACKMAIWHVCPPGMPPREFLTQIPAFVPEWESQTLDKFVRFWDTELCPAWRALYAMVIHIRAKNRLPAKPDPGWSDYLRVSEWDDVFQLNRNEIGKHLRALAGENKAEEKTRQQWRVRLSVLDANQRLRYDTVVA